MNHLTLTIKIYPAPFHSLAHRVDIEELGNFTVPSRDLRKFTDLAVFLAHRLVGANSERNEITLALAEEADRLCNAMGLQFN